MLRRGKSGKRKKNGRGSSVVLKRNVGVPKSLRIEPLSLLKGNLLGKTELTNVYRATYGDEEVAIKCYVSTEGVMTYLKRERELLKELDHPHIVSYCANIPCGTYEMVVEFMPDGDLCRFLKERWTEVDSNFRLQVSFDLASAFAYVHEQGILHADPKTKNVLIDATELPAKAKLCDFDISCKLEKSDPYELEPLKWPVYTEYCKPREVKEGNVCRVSDVFGFGGIVFEMLVGANAMFRIYSNPCSINFYTAIEEQAKKLDPPDKNKSAPEKPMDTIDNTLKALIKLSWSADRRKRRTMPEVVAMLEPLLQK